MSTPRRARFNPPPGWPQPPRGWVPPLGWKPDPSWPKPPEGWLLWTVEEQDGQPQASTGLGTDPPRTPDVPPEIGEATGLEEAHSRLKRLEAENAALRAQLEVFSAGAAEPVPMNDELVLQDVGIYRYHHPLENAVAYQERLEVLSNRIATMVRSGMAIRKSERFTFDGSLAKGQRMTNDLAKLMLRAYNAEAENVVRALRAGNVMTAKKRLDNARLATASLGRMMQMHISDEFHACRTEEIELTADYLMKRQEERESERAERERLREERKVEQELAAAREQLEKERAHIVAVLEKLNANGQTDSSLEMKLNSVDAAIAQNDFRAANIRAGYVYVVSNRGAFGDDVVKIGLTRRLEPRERIDELGDASVPFRFDVHAMYFSEDAVSLENELHARFEQRRLNRANLRREFFFATPAEVRSALVEKVGNLLEFAEHADSPEYLQSVGQWPSGNSRRG